MHRWSLSEAIGTGPVPDDEAEAFARYAPLFLDRLHRLSTLRASAWLTAGERRLLDHALAATVWDCADVGAGEEALEVLAHVPRTRA